MLNCIKRNPDFFSMAPLATERFYAGNTPVKHNAESHTILSLSTVEDLLAEIRAKKEKPILRFLVDTSGTLWFARETFVGVHAPKHYQMTGARLHEAQCITAGNIKFQTSACKKLRGINHRSGDFRPSFTSLRIMLAILVLNEDKLPFNLPKILIVKQLNNQGEVIRKHRWLVSRIRQWVEQIGHNERWLREHLTQHHAKTKIVHYEAFDSLHSPRPNVSEKELLIPA